MKFLYIVLPIIALLIIFAWYIGYFCKIQLAEKEVGPYTVAYAEHIGPYTKVGPVMDQVYNDLIAENIKPTLGYGEYFSNPKITPKEELRSEVGSIIEENDISKLDRTGVKYKVKTLAKNNSLVAEFPYKNILSFMIGPMKVYPAMQKYMDKNNMEWTEDMPSMEIYNMEKKVITFVVNIK